MSFKIEKSDPFVGTIDSHHQMDFDCLYEDAQGAIYMSPDCIGNTPAKIVIFDRERWSVPIAITEDEFSKHVRFPLRRSSVVITLKN
jgi:hypothetical protein